MTLNKDTRNPMRPTDIQSLIETHLKDSTVFVEGEDGRHFQATVISAAFIGKNRIQKQQMVHAALGKHIADGTIHAISIKTWTPDEWNAQS